MHMQRRRTSQIQSKQVIKQAQKTTTLKGKLEYTVAKICNVKYLVFNKKNYDRKRNKKEGGEAVNRNYLCVYLR